MDKSIQDILEREFNKVGFEGSSDESYTRYLQAIQEYKVSTKKEEKTNTPLTDYSSQQNSQEILSQKTLPQELSLRKTLDKKVIVHLLDPVGNTKTLQEDAPKGKDKSNPNVKTKALKGKDLAKESLVFFNKSLTKDEIKIILTQIG